MSKKDKIIQKQKKKIKKLEIENLELRSALEKKYLSEPKKPKNNLLDRIVNWFNS